MNLLRILILSLLLSPLAQAELMVRSVRSDSVQPGGRCWFWFPKGMHASDPAGYQWTRPVTVPDGWRWTFLARTQDGQQWAWQWGFTIHVPADAAPGEYKLPTGCPNEPPLTVTVVAKPAERPLFRATPADSQAEIQSRLNAGYDVELLPGLYVWDTWLDVPDGASIVSAGAKIVRHWNGDPGYFKRVFHPLGSFTLKGVTLSHDESIPYDWFENVCYVHAFPFPKGQLTIQDVTVERGELISSWQQPGALIERCHFRRAGIGHVPHNAVVFDCDFIGRGSTGQHALMNNSANDTLLASLRFDNTTRGIIFQNHYASGCAVVDIDITNIRGGDGHGAGECILLETPWGAANPPHTSMCDNLFLFIRITNSSGPAISFFGDGIRRNIVHDADLGAEQAMLLASISPGGTLGSNDFINVQCQGWIGIYGSHEPQVFNNVSVIWQPPARGNQGPWTTYEWVDQHWPVYVAPEVSKDLEYKFVAQNSLVLPNAVLPFDRIRPLEITTNDAQEKVLKTLWVGWRPNAPMDATMGWFGEYTVTAFDVDDKKKSAVFSRRCKITRVAGEEAKLEDRENGPTFGQSGWTVRNRTNGTALEIVVKGKGNMRWKLSSDIRWERIY